MNNTKIRIDQFLVQSGHASSRAIAKTMLKENLVRINDKVISKGSYIVQENDQIDVTSKEYPVGRGANKLLGYLEIDPIDVTNYVCADVGASTGGFTEVLLERGASKIFAIDVGHDQLAKKLREDNRVINLEGINARNPIEIDEKVDLVVADLSFISLKLTLENMIQLLKKDGKAIILFKPQFEVGKENIGHGGIVRANTIVKQTLEEFVDWSFEKNFPLSQIEKCQIKGKKGNQEFFLYFDYNKSSSRDDLLGKIGALL